MRGETSENRRFRRWVWGFLVVVVVGLGYAGYWVWSLYAQGVWNGSSRQTMAWISGDDVVRVFSYQPVEGAVVFMFPTEGVVDVSRGYGRYEIRSLWGLALQENDFRLIGESLTMLLGGGVFDWVKDDVVCAEELEVECVRDAVWAWTSSDVSSSVPRWDRFALWWKVRSLRSDQIRIIDLSDGSWARPTTAADGKLEVMFDADFVDARVSELLNDRVIRDENLSVEVMNSTNYPGVATELARVVGGLGAHVVDLGNVDANLDRCLLRVRPEVLESATVAGIVRLWDCEVSVLEESTGYDLSLWLGERQAVWVGR